MDKLRLAMSLLPCAAPAPVTPTAPIHGTAASAAVLAVAGVRAAAFGTDLPGPPRGAPV